MAEIQLTESAIEDFEAIRSWYASQGVPGVGEVLIAEVFASTEQLGQFPESGSIVESYEDDTIRQLIHPPFRVIYKTSFETVFIARVLREEQLIPEGLR